MGRVLKGLMWMLAAVLVLCMVLVIARGMQDVRQTVEASGAYAASEEGNPVDEFKTVRQQLRAMQKAQLNDVAHGADTDEELAAMAQRQLLALCEREEDELTLEGILEMRGWENTVVTVHEDSVNVLLQAEVVTRQESSVILELVCRETGVQSGNVKIIPIN